MKKFLTKALILPVIILVVSCSSPGGGTDESREAAADTGGPVVTVINPADGALVSGILLIAGVAADASDVGSVTVSVDGGPFTSSGITADKSVDIFTVSGLTPDATYYFRVHTVTNPHPFNQNTVFSEYTSPPVEVTTTGGE